MASIYERGAALSKRLLAPSRFGQGTVILTHYEPGTPDPAKPFDPVEPVAMSETLRAAVRGVSQKLVGTELGGTVILASDLQAICAPPALSYQAGGSISVDGRSVHVISFDRIPAAGTPSAVRFILRG